MLWCGHVSLPHSFPLSGPLERSAVPPALPTRCEVGGLYGCQLSRPRGSLKHAKAHRHSAVRSLHPLQQREVVSVSERVQVCQRPLSCSLLQPHGSGRDVLQAGGGTGGRL